ncbi:hypothetical protein RHMOL_Rhmol09G0033300 [Rhododendron molle]|uniref:Uncharacterized protein n=1 Tax=Rhododendron molle TaxID=49168 RepID=A0ACC0M968_RHOML|nr:hypothetical protein RHMOL_Rhmol09G0033300 [Rhododendron molle]
MSGPDEGEENRREAPPIPFPLLWNGGKKEKKTDKTSIEKAMELGVEIQEEEPNSASNSEEVQKVQGMDEDICDVTHLFETMDLEVFLLERDDERWAF